MFFDTQGKCLKSDAISASVYGNFKASDGRFFIETAPVKVLAK
jgi:hypothetical protein